jgi:hypothetical protein
VDSTLRHACHRMRDRHRRRDTTSNGNWRRVCCVKMRFVYPPALFRRYSTSRASACRQVGRHIRTSTPVPGEGTMTPMELVGVFRPNGLIAACRLLAGASSLPSYLLPRLAGRLRHLYVRLLAGRFLAAERARRGYARVSRDGGYSCHASHKVR